MTASNKKKRFKKAKLRYNEYYNTQDTFDDLYNKNLKQNIFKNLIPLIKSEDNIKLAYRKIKRNRGSKTSGTNFRSIKDIANMDIESVIKYVQNRIDNYQPHSIKRVEIPKGDGKTRPLGIPTIEDRLIQQCIVQVLEPICEAKFHNHSYGFRPNRSTHHALARACYFINISKLHYVVDIDIKGFFDNVNHAKLLKQMWAMGIRDKNLLCIIGKMLKAEVKDKGIPKVGTPQGGVLSPLLSNIVLNELDWWVSSQWENFETRHEYQNVCNRNRAIRKSSKLKEVYIVRYCDDFKIFCRDYTTAVKMFSAVTKWLQERLQLEVNPGKSKITNLKRGYTNFLGIKLKARPKGTGYVVKSKMTDKSKQKCTEKLKQAIKKIHDNVTEQNVNNYNSTVLGLHNYYSVATMVSKDFKDIAFVVRRCLYNKLWNKTKKCGIKSKAFEKYYGTYKGKTYFVKRIGLFPISHIKTRPPRGFRQETCDYTKTGRMLIHEKLKRCNMMIVRYLMQNPVRNETIEYNDNRISLYVGQNGLCGVSKEILCIGKMEVHHIIPRKFGGTDAYENIVFVTAEAHKLIHATESETIKHYLDIMNPDDETLKNINLYRKKAGNHIIR